MNKIANSINTLINPHKKSWIRSKESLLSSLQNALGEYKEYFEKSSKPLNLSQRLSILLECKHKLILAGAGTGKTSLLIAKIKWLAHFKKAKASEILLLSFTRESVAEARERLAQVNINGVQIQTFHAYALMQFMSLNKEAELLSDFEINGHKNLKEKLVNAIFQFLKETPWDYKKDLEINSTNELFDKSLDVYKFKICAARAQQCINELKDKKQILFFKWFKIFEEIFEEYRQEKNFLFFDHALLESLKALKENKLKCGFKYVLVDEFQDINALRMNWLVALCSQNPNTNLCAVGDDWQSIYRFTGSRLEYLSNFDKYFAGAQGLRLDETFRYHKGIEKISREFLMKNKNQIDKRVHCHLNYKGYSFLIHENFSFLKGLKRSLSYLEVLNEPIKEVLVLGRSNSDLPKVEEQNQIKNQYQKFEVKFCTAHGSKGLEADYVVLLIAGGVNGFPNKRPDDFLLAPFMSAKESKAWAEERRLFYVALTRAKKQVLFVQKKGSPSDFLNEIKEDFPKFGAFLK